MNPAPTGNDRFNAEAAAWDSNPDVHRASDGALQAILAAHPSMRAFRDSSTEAAGGGGLDVLEIGCGTGLLTLRMAPYVRSILAIDAAAGMIDALAAKLEGMRGPEGERARRVVRPLCVLLEDPEDPRLPAAGDGDGDGEGASGNINPSTSSSSSSTGKRMKFDLVTSHLVLHHIPDLKAVLRTMYGCLRPGGQLALTDFEDFGPEARKFHPEAKMWGVERHGIRADWFAGLMGEVGFEDVHVSSAWTMEKEVERFPGEWGEKKPEGVELAKMGFPFLLCRGTRKA